jgi:hypothetical protein
MKVEPAYGKNSRTRVSYRCYSCDLAVGAHDDGTPLGIPADQPTRNARVRAHEAFDKLWRGGNISRVTAYQWLRKTMGMTPDEAHIGRFNVEQCERVVTEAPRYLEHLNKYTHDSYGNAGRRKADRKGR